MGPKMLKVWRQPYFLGASEYSLTRGPVWVNWNSNGMEQSGMTSVWRVLWLCAQSHDYVVWGLFCVFCEVCFLFDLIKAGDGCWVGFTQWNIELPLGLWDECRLETGAKLIVAKRNRPRNISKSSYVSWNHKKYPFPPPRIQTLVQSYERD